MDRRNALKSLSLGVGFTLTAPALAALMTSCKQNSQDVTWKPDYFSKENYNSINELAEIILPKTSTPGAKEVGVGPFIDKMVSEVLKPKDQEEFGLGLEVFNKLADSDGTKELSQDQLNAVMEKHVTSLTDEQITSIDNLLDSEDIPASDGDKDTYVLHSFLRQHKRLALMGYFGSEEIGKNHLSYLPIPGEYEGCIDVASVGNAWSM